MRTEPLGPGSIPADGDPLAGDGAPLPVGAWLVPSLGNTGDGDASVAVAGDGWAIADDSTIVAGDGWATVAVGAALVVTGADVVRGARFGPLCAVVVTGAASVVGGAAYRGSGGWVVVTGAVATGVGTAGGPAPTGPGVVGSSGDGGGTDR